MNRLIDQIIAFSAVLIIAVVIILIGTLTPDSGGAFQNFKWPSSPDQEIPEKELKSSAGASLLAQGAGLEAIERHCLNCHSSRLITQNKMSRQRWADNIKWMQETQGLWDLGSDLPVVLDYLSTYYSPTATGRRANLDVMEIEWYVLNVESKGSSK